MQKRLHRTSPARLTQACRKDAWREFSINHSGKNFSKTRFEAGETRRHRRSSRSASAAATRSAGCWMPRIDLRLACSRFAVAVQAQADVEEERRREVEGVFAEGLLVVVLGL